MKKIKFLAFAMIAFLTASCMDGGYGDVDTSKPAYGDNSMQETNVITIQQLKDKYAQCKSVKSAGLTVEDDIQIKGIVVANDIQGNIFNEIVLQDETGAIGVEVEHGGMFALFPEGAEVLISMKGLYVGTYRGQLQVGTSYTSSSAENYPSRMPFREFCKHFKLTGVKKTVEPKVFGDGATGTFTWNYEKDGGVLGTIKNVSLSYYFDIATLTDVKNINENTQWANPDGGNVSYYFNENLGSYKKEVQMFNSPYSDFAANKIPYGKKINVTGVIKCYANSSGTTKKCEIIIRKIEDVEVIE